MKEETAALKAYGRTERIIDRLDAYMRVRGLNDNRVTVEAKLSVGLLHNARKGKSDLGKKAIDKILATYEEINYIWLLTGEGPMTTNDATDNASVKERLVKFIDFKGISKNKFEQICGLSTRYVSNISQSIQPDKLRVISAVFPELNIDWLIIGRGSMLRTDDEKAMLALLRTVERQAEMICDLHDEIRRIKEAKC